MNEIEKKELVIIPEPNQESITKTYNEIIWIFKAVLFISLIIITMSLINGLFLSV